jgi:POT family proton-dependent oligopeptide transporter
MQEQAAPAVPEAKDLPSPGTTPTPRTPTSHPLGFLFFFWGEFAERCSYYGMRAILFLYLTSVLLFEDNDAYTIQASFKSACYFLPLLGGFLADRFFGKYWTIVGFSVPYVLGHFILGIQNNVALFIALALLAGGSGVIKPNISTLMGMTYDQKRPGQEALRTSAFLWFYFAINIGAVISQYALPKLRSNLINQYHDIGFAYQIAFQFPAWLMVISLAIFAAGKRFYATEKLGPPATLSPEERHQRWQVLTRLFGVFALMVFWWTIYEQNDNLWTAFARDHLNLHWLGQEYAPDGFSFINSLAVITLAPLFGLLFRKIDPEVKVLRATRKILAGFLCQVAASGLMSVAGVLSSGGERVSAWWLVISFVVLTVGEILVYGTGLELAYAAAPANMKGFITGCFLATDGIGNLVHAAFSHLYGTGSWQLSPAPFFALSASIVLLAAVAFYFIGKRFDQVPPAVSGSASA